MYLKALRLHGFKSFADATTLRFEPGVTAVVGPNGCGKSNIADAIRWVLGEQSAKALRGGKMQDVIFEGAETRKPAQICEVGLLLTDCEKQLGSEFHEIEIVRRVHRDGQSEYAFNGQACRLRDIQKLFMDTGVGRTSYSIMAQGQIDQILSSKPEERRAVFEEAAGITKYKSARREALNKLALTDQNLARVADVVAEVSRQIGSLRRQAAKALRYKRVSHRLRHLALAWSAHGHAELQSGLAAMEGELASRRTAAGERRASLEAQQGALEDRKSARSRLNGRAQEAQQAAFDLRSQRDASDNAGKLAVIRRSGLEDRLAAARESLAELEMQLREVSVQADSGAQDKQLQLGLLGSSDAAFQQRNRELALVDGELRRLEQELQQAKFQLLQSESAVARLRTDSSGYEVEQRTSVHRHDALVQEIAGLGEQQAAAGQLAEQLRTREAEAIEEKNAAQGAATAAQQKIGDVTREFRDAQRRLSEIDRQVAQRAARLRLLQQLQERWEGFGEGAKAVLQGRLDGALQGSAVRAILQGVAIQAGAGQAVEALLGAAAEAVAVADLATAGRILAQLEQEQIGSIVLQVGATPPPPPAEEPLPDFLQPAAAAILNPGASAGVRAVLAQCFIAESLPAFLDFWARHPGFSFLAVSTRQGALVDRRGLVAGGHRNEKKAAASLVHREIDLRDTQRALADDQRGHEAQKAAVDDIAARLTAAEQEMEARRGEVMAANQRLAGAQAEQRTAQRAWEEVSGRRARRESELGALERARDEAQARWDKAQHGLVEAEAAAAAQRARIADLETRTSTLRGQREGQREVLAQARLELAERRQKVEVLDRGLGEMARRRQQLSELLLQRQLEIETWSEQVGQLEAEAARQQAQAAQLAGTLAVAQEQVEKIRAELLEVEREITELETAQATLRLEAERAQGELSRHEIKLAGDRQRAEFLAAEMTREYQVELAALDWRPTLWAADDEPPGLKSLDLEDDEAAEPAGETAAPGRRRKPRAARGAPTAEDLAALDQTNWDEVKVEVDALRQRLAAMGAVNLVAIEEYGELRQRHDFLQAQSSDLINAKTELIRAIDEINQTSQQQFQVTFEQIRKNFEYTFQTLFGGGRAHLELVAAEDVLESGIEIVAQPPGTKLKGISLLSGGQKTLTAVALLFALYMVKPSPFCLLDELDAPLDESNIGRFTDLLRRFVAESQFIIITHNKRTVSAASAIYGVTMEERGVSKTVSMRFNRERGEAEVHTPTLADSVNSAAPPAALAPA